VADLNRFRSLTLREQALVCIAVMIDGHDAVDYLQNDRDRAVALSRVAKDLASLEPELRLPLLGTLLRNATNQL
jgi:hypothetical protein